MTRLALLSLAVLLTACAPAVTPTPDPRPAAKAADEADRLADIAATQERQSQNSTFEYEQTATALPFSVTALAQERALTQIYVDGKAADAAATQIFRVTESAYSAIVIPTKIAAVGTELARGAEKQKADVAAAKSRRDMWAGAPLAALVVVGLFVAWIASLIYTNHKKRDNIAKAELHIIGDSVYAPTGNGGWTVHKIVYPERPALAAPVAIENRDVPVNHNGHTGSIHVSQPVNEHEKIWRLFLYEVGQMFQQYGLSSTATCGAGKPFSSGTTWKIVTDIMRDNGLILKDNGDDTLPNGEWGDVLTRIQDANKPLKLPARLPPPLRKFTAQNV